MLAVRQRVSRHSCYRRTGRGSDLSTASLLPIPPARPGFSARHGCLRSRGRSAGDRRCPVQRTRAARLTNPQQGQSLRLDGCRAHRDDRWQAPSSSDRRSVSSGRDSEHRARTWAGTDSGVRPRHLLSPHWHLRSNRQLGPSQPEAESGQAQFPALLQPARLERVRQAFLLSQGSHNRIVLAPAHTTCALQ